MLNPKTGQRELAYIVTVASVRPLPGYDRVHYINILGWWCVAPVELQAGDLAVYFEVDSLLPESDKRFLFMAPRKYRVRTIKMCKAVSQGLALPISSFPELAKKKPGEFVTDILKVQLYDPEPVPVQRKQKEHTSEIIRFLLRFPLFRFIYGRIWKSGEKKEPWPEWLPKTNSERIQNMPQLFDSSTVVNVVGENEISVPGSQPDTYIATEKVDGASASYILDGKDTYLIGSHNVIVYSATPKQRSKGLGNMSGNLWCEIEGRYGLLAILTTLKNEHHLKTVAIQGEAYGSGVQKRTYSKRQGEHDFVVFHLWFDGERLPVQEMAKICAAYRLHHVHIYDDSYVLPPTVEELIADIDHRKSAIDGKEIEGFVLYSQDGKQNVKCVSPSYLLKYH